MRHYDHLQDIRSTLTEVLGKLRAAVEACESALTRLRASAHFPQGGLTFAVEDLGGHMVERVVDDAPTWVSVLRTRVHVVRDGAVQHSEIVECDAELERAAPGHRQYLVRRAIDRLTPAASE